MLTWHYEKLQFITCNKQFESNMARHTKVVNKARANQWPIAQRCSS